METNVSVRKMGKRIELNVIPKRVYCVLVGFPIAVTILPYMINSKYRKWLSVYGANIAKFLKGDLYER